jgi:hypothetical protein
VEACEKTVIMCLEWLSRILKLKPSSRAGIEKAKESEDVDCISSFHDLDVFKLMKTHVLGSLHDSEINLHS